MLPTWSKKKTETAPGRAKKLFHGDGTMGFKNTPLVPTKKDRHYPRVNRTVLVHQGHV